MTVHSLLLWSRSTLAGDALLLLPQSAYLTILAVVYDVTHCMHRRPCQ